MDIAQKVAKQIEEGRIKPIPKVYFVARQVFVWTAVAGTVVLTGIACGVMVYLIRSHEWSIGEYAGDSMLHRIAVAMPYFWVLVATGLLALAVVNSHRLRRGYAVRPVVYMSLYGALALLVGVAIAESGRGAQIEEKVAEVVPAYETMVRRPDDDWYRPDIGLMAGHIVEVTSSGLVLKDCHGGQWMIDDQTAEWRCGSGRRLGARIKLIGEQVGERTFMVNRVLPWDVTLAGMDNCIRNRALSE